ncbi:hypothetical protein ACP4OV_022806 [Aristida adscensionis]
MTLTIPEEVRAKAEVYVGDAAGQEKTRLLLQETGLPSGLLPLRDILECGYVEETGFVWLRQRRRVDHFFPKAGRHVSYAAEVSAVADKGRLRKITGVKAKEMLLWVNLHEICLDDPPSGKLVCKAIGGLSRSFPVDAFEADHPPPPLPPLKPPPAAAAVANGNGNGNAAVAAEKEQAAPAAKKESAGEAEKKEKEEEEAKKETTAGAGEEKEKPKEEEEKEKDGGGGGGVEEVEAKLKEMGGAEVVHAEAVAAKN